MLDGAYLAAKFNVYVNLKHITDTKFIEDVHTVLAPFEDEMPALKHDILERCEDILAG